MELTDVTTVKRRFLYYTGVMLTLRFVTTETCRRVRELKKKKERWWAFKPHSLSMVALLAAHSTHQTKFVQ